jgi:hypothetical protein
MDIRRLRVDALQEYAAKGPAERKQVEAGTTSASQAYSHPGLVFPNSLYVQIVGTGFAQGSVELE